MSRAFVNLFSTIGIAYVFMASGSLSAQDLRTTTTIETHQDVVHQEGVETLLRGPLHEAFARPVELEVKETLLVLKEPPEPIEEIPPEVKPDDERVEWIPGYWAWEEERDDFIWVSGIWRVPPPDRRWVPGYWSRESGGYRWVSGFWESTEAEEITYLPYPPESLDEGPNQPAPTPDHYWVAGQWLFRDGRYAWRPGYWNTYHEGWTWNPSRYVWTPTGAIFVNGYWDYPFANRGVLFAPTYFTSPVYRQRGYFYSPTVAVNVSRLALNMFVNTGYNHYYWGDYYSPRYAQLGFSPWMQYQGARYDPVLSYYRTAYRRQGIDYDQRARGWYDYYYRNEGYRPPRTFAEQLTFSSRVRNNGNLQYAMLGAAVTELITGSNTTQNVGGFAFQRVPIERRRAFGQSSAQFRELGRQRNRVETTVVVNQQDTATVDSDTTIDTDTTTDRDRSTARDRRRAEARADARLELPRATTPAASTSANRQAPRAPERPAQEQRTEGADDAATDDAAKSRRDRSDPQRGRNRGNRGDRATDTDKSGRESRDPATPDSPAAPAATETPATPSAPASPAQPATDSPATDSPATQETPAVPAVPDVPEPPTTTDDATTLPDRSADGAPGDRRGSRSGGRRGQSGERTPSTDSVIPPPADAPAVDRPRPETPGTDGTRRRERPDTGRTTRERIDPDRPSVVRPPASTDAPSPGRSETPATSGEGAPAAGAATVPPVDTPRANPQRRRGVRSEGDSGRTTRGRADLDRPSVPGEGAPAAGAATVPPVDIPRTGPQRSRGDRPAGDSGRTTRGRVDLDTPSVPGEGTRAAGAATVPPVDTPRANPQRSRGSRPEGDSGRTTRNRIDSDASSVPGEGTRGTGAATVPPIESRRPDLQRGGINRPTAENPGRASRTSPRENRASVPSAAAEPRVSAPESPRAARPGREAPPTTRAAQPPSAPRASQGNSGDRSKEAKGSSGKGSGRGNRRGEDKGKDKDD